MANEETPPPPDDSERADPEKQRKMALALDMLVPRVDHYLRYGLGERHLFAVIISAPDGNTLVCGNGDSTIMAELIQEMARQISLGTVMAMDPRPPTGVN